MASIQERLIVARVRYFDLKPKRLPRRKTSLNMFKHYKLKPSFPIIKDNKEKDRAGQAGVGGGQAPTPKFQLILI